MTRKIMQKRRFTLPGAVLFSVLLHFFLVAGSEMALPDFYTAPDEVLERKKATHIQHVQIVAAAAAPAKVQAAAGVRFVRIKKTGPAKKKLRKPPPPETAARKSAEEPEPAPNADSPVPAGDVAKPVETVVAGTAPAPEPAPAFPIQINAVLEARYNGIPFTIRQSWVMEGLRYAIDLSAKRFGFHFQLSSEGSITPQGGLSPEHYRLLLNNNLRTMADYANGEIRYGKPSELKTAALPVVPQDTASLPFHVAVTFTGQPQSIFVTTGNSVYQIRLFVDAEEKLKLPGGTIRTLHLLGERFDPKLGQMVTGYEVWLAPDYLNYPVKFIGHTSNGDRFEYRVKELVLEGRRVLGEKSDDSEEPADDAIPDWIRQRALPESQSNR
jgi:hypothetical protein